MSHKFSTALRNTGADADFVGFASLHGVDPASPANLHKTRASTRSPFARYEFCETCGLKNILAIFADSALMNYGVTGGESKSRLACPALCREEPLDLRSVAKHGLGEAGSHPTIFNDDDFFRVDYLGEIIADDKAHNFSLH